MNTAQIRLEKKAFEDTHTVYLLYTQKHVLPVGCLHTLLRDDVLLLMENYCRPQVVAVQTGRLCWRLE